MEVRVRVPPGSPIVTNASVEYIANASNPKDFVGSNPTRMKVPVVEWLKTTKTPYKFLLLRLRGSAGTGCSGKPYKILA